MSMWLGGLPAPSIHVLFRKAFPLRTFAFLTPWIRLDGKRKPKSARSRGDLHQKVKYKSWPAEVTLIISYTT